MSLIVRLNIIDHININHDNIIHLITNICIQLMLSNIAQIIRQKISRYSYNKMRNPRLWYFVWSICTPLCTNLLQLLMCADYVYDNAWLINLHKIQINYSHIPLQISLVIFIVHTNLCKYHYYKYISFYFP